VEYFEKNDPSYDGNADAQKRPDQEVFHETPWRRMAPCAADVASLFPLSEPQDLSEYREVSTVLSLHKGFVFLKRDCGDVLFLHQTNITPGFKSRWNLLEFGSPVNHGAAFDTDSQRWRAVDAELYSYDELESFKNEAQPEPVTEPTHTPQPAHEHEPVPEQTSLLLLPENRGRTLLELIKSQGT
jgi:hypothetical protein